MSESHSNVYNSDIEMIMDFLKLSIISNDNSQSENRRGEALNLQKAMLETLPVAQSNRIAKIYSNMHKIYELNRDSTVSGAVKNELQRLQELNRDVASLREEKLPSRNTVRGFIDPRAQAVTHNVRPIQEPQHQLATKPNMVVVRGVKPYQAPVASEIHPYSEVLPMKETKENVISPRAPNAPDSPTHDIVNFSTRTLSPVTSSIVDPAISPIIGHVIGSTQNSRTVFRPNAPSKSNRFMVMVGDTGHRENERVMPIWDAYKQEVMNSAVRTPIVVRQFDVQNDGDTIKTLIQKLNLNPITTPSIYRVDLSSGQPRVMRFMQPITLNNLRSFSQFNEGV